MDTDYIGDGWITEVMTNTEKNVESKLTNVLPTVRSICEHSTELTECKYHQY